MTESESNYLDPELLARLPQLPAVASVPRPHRIWIVEWLSETDKRTGFQLYEWLEEQFPDWSSYYRCTNKQEVLDSIECATQYANNSLGLPLLHLEAHGNGLGLAAAREFSDDQFLSWDELVDPFQALNLGTRCNLIIFVASCIGFAGIQAFARGPRAPAVAMVGPDSVLGENVLFRGTKELYRRLCDKGASLTEAAESASRETSPAGFEVEPLACMAFESLVMALTKYTPDELPPADIIQAAWDELFMIDIYPANTERFGMDMSRVLDVVSEWLRTTENNRIKH